MDPIVTPALLLFGILAFSDKLKPKDANATASGPDDDDVPPAEEPTPSFDPAARAMMLVQGAPVQTFNPRLRNLVRTKLGTQAITELTLDPNERGRLFKLVAGESDASVATLLHLAAQKNFTVLGSLTLALTDTTAPQYVLIIPRGDESRLAFAGAAFAVLSESPVMRPIEVSNPKIGTNPPPPIEIKSAKKKKAEPEIVNGASHHDAADSAEKDESHASPA